VNEIERLKAELEAAKRELAEANDYLAAVESGDTKAKPPKQQRQPKPKTKPKRRRGKVHRNDFRSSIEGYGGSAPVGTSRQRTSNRPVVTKQYDPMTRPNVYEYKPRECLIIAAVDAGSSLTGLVCRCAICNI
jgi:hypothetical protein